MYWRIRSLTPEQLIRQYGLHLLLIVSFFFNTVLFLTRPAQSKKVSGTLRRSFEQLARDVTQQLLDKSYLNFEKNTIMLLTAGELDPPLVRTMKQNGLLPDSQENFKAMIRSLTDEKMVAAVRIDQIIVGEPTQNNLQPLDVGGVMATHSASGADQHTFHIRYIMGQRKTNDKEANPEINAHSHFAGGGAQPVEVQVPVVASIEDLSNQPMPAQPTGAPDSE